MNRLLPSPILSHSLSRPLSFSSLCLLACIPAAAAPTSKLRSVVPETELQHCARGLASRWRRLRRASCAVVNPGHGGGNRAGSLLQDAPQKGGAGHGDGDAQVARQDGACDLYKGR
ncbi:hypothetical protein PVAP13_3NG234200 [Panicum virgatum]|uniref:Secreted protein n=1 Tax=Panicum virgatum TaxID=38727 RepID=A0A8T0UK56_PANVG|nr:hypothetical protein PVAP13_3NG234200 [Panicum virgatum]